MKTYTFGAVLALSGLALLGAPGAVRAQETGTAATTPKRTISIDFRQTPIREALTTLFTGTGNNYALTAAAEQAAPTVTLSLQDVSFDTALNILTRTAGLKYSRDKDGVYIIDVRGVDTTSPVAPSVPAMTPETAAPEVAPPLQIEKIPLNYVAAIDMYGALSGQGSNSAASSMGGSSGGFGGGGFGGSGGFGGGGFGGSGGFGGGGFGGGGFGGSGGFGGGGFGGSGGFGGGGFGGSGGFGGGGFGGGGFGGGGFGGGGFGR